MSYLDSNYSWHSALSMQDDGARYEEAGLQYQVLAKVLAPPLSGCVVLGKHTYIVKPPIFPKGHGNPYY